MSFQESSKENIEPVNSILQSKGSFNRPKDSGFIAEVNGLFNLISKNLQDINIECSIEDKLACLTENDQHVAKVKKILQLEISRDKTSSNKGGILSCERQLQQLLKRVNAAKEKVQNQQQTLLEEQEAFRDEESGLGQGQLLSDIDFITYEDSLQARKQRMQNAHRSMQVVNQIYKQIDSMTAEQSEQILNIDTNISSTLVSVKQTNQELVKAKFKLEKDSKGNTNFLFLLIAFLVVLIIAIKVY